MGRIERVLFEEEIIEGVKYQLGHNERYLKIAIASEENLTNQIIKVEIKKS